MLLENVRKRGTELAVDDGTTQRNWRELMDRALRFAHFLNVDMGLDAGAHVAILMRNRTEIVELLYGSVFAAQWLTPINWHLSEDEIDYVVRDSTARVIVTDPHFAPLLARITRDRPEVRTVVVGPELDALLDATGPEQTFEEPDLAAPAGGNMIYTSGTTGRPKGVKRAVPASIGDALELYARSARNIGLGGAGPHLITGPMYHAAPLMFAIYDNVCGAPILIMPRWDEREALRLLQEREVAHVHLVPTMFVRLLRLPEEERAAFHAPALEVVLHGAAPVSVPVKERMIDWWGPILVEYWGGSEGGVNTLIGSEEWRAHPGTVGKALPAFDVFAVDDRGERLGPGEVGDLYCRSSLSDRPFEYHGAPEKTEDAYLAPGVYTIGDIGSVDEEGYVRLADRRSNMIISGGVNIYPAEIEQVIAEHPAVADVGVFGIPDDEWGESVKAAIELRPGETPSDTLATQILDFARKQLAGYKIPRSIDFEETLPRHPSGKLYTRRLRDRYWAGRDKQI